MARLAYVNDGTYDYIVSSDGDVFSFKGKVVRKLKPRMNNRGYLRVRINGKERLVHDLVAESFLHKGSECTVVNHKDEDKTNNSLSNLEWCTQKYNTNYSKYKLYKPVAQYDKQGNLMKTYEKSIDVEKDGFCASTVSLCCNHKQDNYKGYKWEFINKSERTVV